MPFFPKCVECSVIFKRYGKPTNKSKFYFCSLKHRNQSSIWGKIRSKIAQYRKQETVIKQAESLKKTWEKRRNELTKTRVRGNKHPRWKGGIAWYATVHFWIAKNVKKIKCEYCGTPNRKTKTGNRSYLHNANISGKYLYDISDWIVLCSRCHIIFDKKMQKDNFI